MIFNPKSLQLINNASLQLSKMLLGATVFFLLFIHVFSDFKLVPQGDGIALAICKIAVRNDSYFSSTIPYLKRGRDGRAFEFIDARNELGPGFQGDHSPDPSNPTLLFAILTIRDYTSAKMLENLICSATLSNDNDTEIQYSLLLEEPGNNSLCDPKNRETIPYVTPWKEIGITVVVVLLAIPVVVLLLSIPFGIFLTAVFVYRYIKRRKQSYRLKDVPLLKRNKIQDFVASD